MCNIQPFFYVAMTRIESFLYQIRNFSNYDTD